MSSVKHKIKKIIHKIIVVWFSIQAVCEVRTVIGSGLYLFVKHNVAFSLSYKKKQEQTRKYIRLLQYVQKKKKTSISMLDFTSLTRLGEDKGLKQVNN